MPIQIITQKDLYEFKLGLLEDIETLLETNFGKNSNKKKWLRSAEVRKILGISQSSLQNMRIKGTISYSQIGRILYYDYQEIMTLIKDNRISNKFEKSNK